MTSETDSALTGAAFELAAGGFTPMPEEEEKDQQEAIGSDGASLREAAAQQTSAHDEVVVREYLDESGKPVAPNEAVTLARAGRDYASAIAADSAAAENETSEDLAARVDALRAEALAHDPGAAEFYGFKLPESRTGADQNGRERPSGEPADTSEQAASTALDPELARALEHPQVRQAIEQQLGEAEKTRQDYLNGLAAATQIAQVSFISQFPELANVAPDNLPGALEQMSRQDPARFARVQAMVTTTEQLFAQQQEESRRQAEMTRQGFRNYAQTEDTRFETALKGETAATRAAVAAEIVASAKASGVEARELMRLFNSEPLMRHAVFQRMMYDAGKYRLAMKARDAIAARSVPPVQRPGIARTPAEREHADLRTLNARLSNSGDIKDAVALYHAKKSSRR